jgi:hypothetical protein
MVCSMVVVAQMGFHPSMGNAGAAMCSYAGVNGVPSCAHDYLLNEVRATGLVAAMSAH